MRQATGEGLRGGPRHPDLAIPELLTRGKKVTAALRFPSHASKAPRGAADTQGHSPSASDSGRPPAVLGRVSEMSQTAPREASATKHRPPRGFRGLLSSSALKPGVAAGEQSCAKDQQE